MKKCSNDTHVITTDLNNCKVNTILFEVSSIKLTMENGFIPDWRQEKTLVTRKIFQSLHTYNLMAHIVQIAR